MNRRCFIALAAAAPVAALLAIAPSQSLKPQPKLFASFNPAALPPFQFHDESLEIVGSPRSALKSFAFADAVEELRRR